MLTPKPKQEPIPLNKQPYSPTTQPTPWSSKNPNVLPPLAPKKQPQLLPL